MAETTGERIRQLRGDLSQAEFASKIGVHKEMVGKYERGQNVPGGDVLTRMHDVFGVSLDWLLTGQGQMHPAPRVDALNQEYRQVERAPQYDAKGRLIDETLGTYVFDAVISVYNECGARLTGNAGAVVSRIYNEIVELNLDTWEEKMGALRYALTQLRRRLQTSNQTEPGAAQGKQSA